MDSQYFQNYSGPIINSYEDFKLVDLHAAARLLETNFNLREHDAMQDLIKRALVSGLLTEKDRIFG